MPDPVRPTLPEDFPREMRIVLTHDASEKTKLSESKTLDHLVELVRALAWPTLIAVFLLAYHGTTRKIAEELPTLLSHASKVSAGGLDIEIREQAQQIGGDKLSDAVAGLNGDAIEHLLMLDPERNFFSFTSSLYVIKSKKTYLALQDEHKLSILHQLEAHGLIQVFTGSTSENNITLDDYLSRLAAITPVFLPENKGPLYDLKTLPPSLENVWYKMTKLGRDARKSIVVAISIQVNGTKAADRSASEIAEPKATVIRTPQEIYDELQKLQKQRHAEGK